MDYQDYYRILGVPRTASAEEIKRAYRKLAREYHPDRNKAAGSEDTFKRINEANEVLSDPEKRRAYDSLGANWKAGSRFTPPPGWSGRGGRGRAGAQGDFSDFFSSLFGGGGDFEGGGFGGNPFGGGTQDTRARLAISLEDAYNGATREVRLHGRALNVRIPKGVTAGQSIRLSGQGSQGGDLLLEIEFTPHAHFRLEGRDVHSTLNIAPWEAALGATVEIPTLGGTVEMNLPAGSQGGKKLRLKGRGLHGTPAGDQIVTLNIVTPPASDEAGRKLYEQMRAQFRFDPRA